MKKLFFALILFFSLSGCVFNIPKEQEFIGSNPNFRPEARFLISAENEEKDHLRDKVQEEVRRRCGRKGYEWKVFIIYDEKNQKFWGIEYVCR